MWAFMLAASLVAGSHIRSADPVIGPALADNLRRSDVVKRLADVIDGSNVFVYLARGECPRPAVACLMMAGGGPGFRYVRINFRLPIGLGQPNGWHQDDLSVAIAHELQHAAEIAVWADVVDSPTLEAAYVSRGMKGCLHLDSEAAIHAGEARREELRRARKR